MNSAVPPRVAEWGRFTVLLSFFCFFASIVSVVEQNKLSFHKILSDYQKRIMVLCNKDTAMDTGLNIWFDGDPDDNGSKVE